MSQKLLHQQVFFNAKKVTVSKPEPIDHELVHRITVETDDGIFMQTIHVKQEGKKTK